MDYLPYFSEIPRHTMAYTSDARYAVEKIRERKENLLPGAVHNDVQDILE